MISVNWEPSREGLLEVVQILKESKNHDPQSQTILQQKLDSMSLSTDFNRYLLYILKNGVEENDGYTRMLAGTILKNNIHAHNLEYEIDFVTLLKSNILSCLVDPCREVRLAAANIICELAVIDTTFCHEAVPLIFNIIQLSTIEIAKNAFDAMERICEDISDIIECSRQNQTSIITTITLNLIQYFQHPLAEYKYKALKCVGRFIAIHSAEIQGEDIQFVPMFLKLMADESSSMLIKEVCSTIVTLVDVSFEHIKPVLPRFIEYLIKAFGLGDVQISLEATEFWISLMDHSTCKEYMRSALPVLTPILIRNMRYSKEDSWFDSYQECDADIEDHIQDIDPSRKNQHTAYSDDSDNEYDDDEGGNEWTLRKCSAYTLDRMSHVFGGELIQYLTPLNTMFSSSDWLDIEAGILAIGAISEGCNDQASTFFSPLFTFILNSTQHQIALIRSISCWTLSRYFSFLLNAPDNALEKTAIMILDKLNDRNKFAQKGGIMALIVLFETCGSRLGLLLERILQQIFISLTKLKTKNLINLYEMIGVLAQYVTVVIDADQFKSQLIPNLLERAKFFDTKSSKLSLSLFDCITTIILSMKIKFTPYINQTLSLVLSIIEQGMNQFIAASQHPTQVNAPDEEYINCSLDILAALIQSNPILITEYLSKQNAIPLIARCCMYSSPRIRQSAFACVGELAQYCFILIQPNMENFLKILCTFYQNDTYSTKNNGIWAIGKIMRNAELDSACYIDIIVPIFTSIISSPDVPRYVIENTIICFSIIALKCTNAMSKYLPNIIAIWCHCITKMKQTIEKETCALGLCSVLFINFSILSDNLDIISYAFSSFNSPSSELRSTFSFTISTFLNQYPQHDRNNIMSHIPTSTLNRLQTMYGI